MHVNDHKIQDMWLENVENGFYHFMKLINVTRRMTLQFFSSKNQHD